MNINTEESGWTMLIRTNEVTALIVNLKAELLITEEWSGICKKDLKMKLKKDGTDMFFGCSSFPDCKHTVNFREGWYKFNEVNQIKIDMQDINIRF